MKFNDIIRTAMREANINQAQLGELIGLKQTSVSSTVVRPNITLAKFITVMDALGYDIIVQPRNPDSDGYTLTNK